MASAPDDVSQDETSSEEPTDRAENPAPMLNLRRYWRVPTFLVVGMVVGFLFSFLFGEAYEAKTHILNRVNNATFLSGDGRTIAEQNAAFEQTGLALMLAQTEGAVLDNRAISVDIVEDLDLDAKDEEEGWFQSLKGAFITTVKVVYSYVRYGTYKELSDFDQAVKDTQSGLSAQQVGNSYVIEVSGIWKTPEQAEAVANQAADRLVAESEQQFQTDTDNARANLADQLTQAGERAKTTTAQVAEFANANDIAMPSFGATLTPDLTLTLAPEQQATYLQLLQDYNTAYTAYAQLQAAVQQADVNAAVKPVQLTRLDEAVSGIYPVAPKRWLYMAIGAVLGAMIGLWLTARAFWRQGETLFPRDDDPTRRPAMAGAPDELEPQRRDPSPRAGDRSPP